jgi:Holliday junction DNA helicase RuvA
MAAILEKKVEFLTRTSGIGRKTAERIILELHNKIKLPESKALTEKMSLDIEVEEALAGLGYRRADIKKALAGVGAEAKTLEERLRKTLKILSQTK